MAVEHRRHADLVEELRGAARVVEAHADLARRTATDAVRKRHDVMVQHHEAMARGLELGALADLAEPGELRRSDRAVVPEEAALRPRARVEADETRRSPRARSGTRRPDSWSSRPIRAANARHAARFDSNVGFGRPLPRSGNR